MITDKIAAWALGVLSALLLIALVVTLSVTGFKLNNRHTTILGLQDEISNPVTGYRQQVATLQTNLTTAKNNVVVLQGTLNTQTAEVLRWQAAAATADSQAQVALAAAGKANTQLDAQGVWISKQIAAGNDNCASISALITGSVVAGDTK